MFAALTHPRTLFLLVAAATATVLIARSWPQPPSIPLSVNAPRETPEVGAMLQLPGGVFVRGRSGGGYDVEPAREILISAFSIDVCEVTNEQFAEFVAATGYRTTAELQGFGRVFDAQQRKTVEVAGATWNHPEGPDSTVVGREQNPVVQISWHDALAYADWSGKRLPTEAEYEYAARGGLNDYDYPWRAAEKQLRGAWLTNTWQGEFPHRPDPQDGFPRLAPTARYPANPFGLYDLVGNAREWCADRYASDYFQISPKRDPLGPDEGELRVVRGGSWLSPDETYEATVWRRAPLHALWCDDQTGFRCAQSAGDRLAESP